MNPFDITFTLRRLLLSVLAFLLWSCACTAGGYLYHAHKEQVKDAAQEGKQEIVTTAVTTAADTIDSQKLMELNGKLLASQHRTRTLEQRIKEQSRETPAPADCRLPVRLLDAINNRLATGQEGTADPVR